MNPEQIIVSINSYTTLCIAAGFCFGILATGFTMFVMKESKR